MITYRRMAERIALTVDLESENDTNHELLICGIEVILSTMINLLLLISLSFVLGITHEVAIFLLFFIPVRCFSGGRHQKNHILCISIFTIVMLICITLADFISIYVGDIYSYLLHLLVLWGCIWGMNCRYAAKAKRVSEKVTMRHWTIVK